MKHYVIFYVGTNSFQLDWCDSLNEAIDRVYNYEVVDMANGNYVPHCYEILLTDISPVDRNLTDDEILDCILV